MNEETVGYIFFVFVVRNNSATKCDGKLIVEMMNSVGIARERLYLSLSLNKKKNIKPNSEVPQAISDFHRRNTADCRPTKATNKTQIVLFQIQKKKNIAKHYTENECQMFVHAVGGVGNVHNLLCPWRQSESTECRDNANERHTTAKPDHRR